MAYFGSWTLINVAVLWLLRPKSLPCWGRLLTKRFVISPENCAALYRAISKFALDKDKGNKRGVIGRMYAKQQRKKGKALTGIIVNLKALLKNGNGVSIIPYPKA